MHLDCPLTSCRVLSRCPLTLLSVCLRVRRRCDVKLQGNATNTFMSNVAIVDFFATMFGTSVSDISSANKFFNVCVHAFPLSCVVVTNAYMPSVAPRVSSSVFPRARWRRQRRLFTTRAALSAQASVCARVERHCASDARASVSEHVSEM